MSFEDASSIFDSYIDWPKRLARETPHLIKRLREAQAKDVADVACGIGRHALALAKEGFEVTAIDPDPVLLEKARDLAHGENTKITFVKAGFESLPETLSHSFDGVICLGNSLALCANEEELKTAMTGLSTLLRPRGRLMAHTINFPNLSRRPLEPWGPVRSLDDNTLILKGFVPQDRGPWDVFFILLEKTPSQSWDKKVFRFQIYPHSRDTIMAAGQEAGLSLVSIHGGFLHEKPDDPKSSDLLYEFLKT